MTKKKAGLRLSVFTSLLFLPKAPVGSGNVKGFTGAGTEKKKGGKDEGGS